MLDLLILKRMKIRKRSNGTFVRKNLKRLASLLKNVTGSEVTLTHKAEHPSNYFSSSFAHCQVE